MKKLLAVLLAAMMTLVFVACAAPAQEAAPAPAAAPATEAAPAAEAAPAPAEEKPLSEYHIALIVQQSDPWYDDMELGVKKYAEDTGVDAYVLTPESGDPALQVALMEELIAQQVDAICVNPNDPQSLKTVIKKAQDAGIPVITHEAPDIAPDVDLDLEAFADEVFGQAMGEALAQLMGGKGEYCGFVGQLTMTTHMAWYNAATKYIAEKYPEMTLVSEEPFIDGNDFQVAYDKTLEVLKAYPNIKGMFDCSIHGAAISQVLIDKGLDGQIMVASLAQPSMSAKYLKNGSMQYGQGWRPYDTGYALMAAGLMLAQGQEITTGTNLGITGYESLTREGNLALGNGTMVFSAENVDEFSY